MRFFISLVLFLEMLFCQESPRILLYRMTGEPIPLVILNKVEPKYPKELQEKGVGGTVIFRVTVSEGGMIVGLPLLIKKAHPVLVRETYFAMMQWRYKPVLANGKPTSFETDVHVIFVPKKKNPAP